MATTRPHKTVAVIRWTARVLALLFTLFFFFWNTVFTIGSIVTDLHGAITEDYLVRQMNWNISADGGGVSMDFRFYDFNQQITIKAPLDPQGNLLPVWTYPTPTP